MRKLNYLVLALFLFQLSGFSQSQDFKNGDLQNVNTVLINDPGPKEGIKWLNTSSYWCIDVSPEDRSNADGNLNIYGSTNKIMLWRPTVIKGNTPYLFLSSSNAPAENRNWYQAVGNDGSFTFSTADDNYTWKRSILKLKRNGYVGVGTTNPQSKLSVYGSSAEGWNSGLELNREGGGKAVIVVDNDGMKLRTLNNGDGFYFRDNDNLTSLVIKDGGDVGIGTNDPKAKLSVNGLIISKEVKVLADISKYPDFVFSEGYELKSLKEVEKYIAENKHLPEIPKADEVGDGIALGEMNNKLLQKIEELTLYVIEQNNELERLKETLIKNGIE